MSASAQFWQRFKHSWLGAFSSVFAARFLASAAAFLTTAVMARVLGPALFGQLTVLLVFMRVMAGLIGPALDTGLVRYAARSLSQSSPVTNNRHQPETLTYFQVIFWAKAILSVVFILAGLLGARLLYGVLFDGAEMNQGLLWSIPLTLLGASLLMGLDFCKTWFQSHQLFRKYANVEVQLALLRLALVVVFVVTGWKTVLAMVVAAVAAPLVLIFAAGSALPRAAYGRPRAGGRVVKELFGFTKWVLAACVFTSISQGVDVFLLTFTGAADTVVGDYGAARQLMLIGDLLVTLTLFNVLLPRASQLESAAQVRAFLKKFRLPTLLFTVALAPMILGADPVARLTFGPAYADAGRLFAILLTGTLFALACAPATTAVYGLGRSHVIAFIEGVKLVAILGAGYWATLNYGAFGTAWTVTGVKAFIGIATYVAAHREIERIHVIEARDALSGRIE